MIFRVLSVIFPASTTGNRQRANDTSTKSFTKPTHSRRREAQSSSGAAKSWEVQRKFVDPTPWGYWEMLI